LRRKHALMTLEVRLAWPLSVLKGAFFVLVNGFEVNAKGVNTV